MNKSLGNIFKGDKVVWMVFFFLCIISIVEVFSASSSLTYKGGSYWGPVVGHSVKLLIGVFVMVCVSNVQCKYFKVATVFVLLASIGFLVWVLLFGQSTNEASRWMDLGFFRFQPSEIAKGALVLSVAQILSAMQTEKGADRQTMKFILITVAPIILLIGVENFSTAALLCLVVLMMMILGRVPMTQIGKLMGVAMLAVVMFLGLIMIVGHDTREEQSENRLTEVVQKEKAEKGSKVFHRFDTWKGRIMKFLDNKEVPPEKFDLDKNAQVGYSNIAIASSNVVGKGPGNSEQRDFLPQAFSDFIYAIIIEEMGIWGAFFVALLYIVLLFRTGRIANRCENNFPAFLSMGLGLLLVSQALFNMLVAVGLAPVTGQPLPLISRGGTSSIINCVYIGMILSISRSAKKKQEFADEVEETSN